MITMRAEDLTHGNLDRWLTVPVGLETRNVFAREITFARRGTSLRILITGHAEHYELPAYARVTVHDADTKTRCVGPGQYEPVLTEEPA